MGSASASMALSPRRSGSIWRKGTKGSGSCGRRRPLSEGDDMRCRFPLTVIASVLALATLSGAGDTLRFYADDPIAREPESQDASGAAPVDIGLMYELSYNLFVTANYTPSNTRAGNVNTIDEVPDSSWFVNR